MLNMKSGSVHEGRFSFLRNHEKTLDLTIQKKNFWRLLRISRRDVPQLSMQLGGRGQGELAKGCIDLISKIEREKKQTPQSLRSL